MKGTKEAGEKEEKKKRKRICREVNELQITIE
jgi:hypothetical protein